MVTFFRLANNIARGIPMITSKAGMGRCLDVELGKGWQDKLGSLKRLESGLFRTDPQISKMVTSAGDACLRSIVNSTLPYLNLIPDILNMINDPASGKILADDSVVLKKLFPHSLQGIKWRQVLGDCNFYALPRFWEGRGFLEKLPQD